METIKIGVLTFEKRTAPETRSALRSIRSKCVECSGGNPKEPKFCQVFDCALWPYRMGVRPATLREKSPELTTQDSVILLAACQYYRETEQDFPLDLKRRLVEAGYLRSVNAPDSEAMNPNKRVCVEPAENHRSASAVMDEHVSLAANLDAL